MLVRVVLDFLTLVVVIVFCLIISVARLVCFVSFDVSFYFGGRIGQLHAFKACRIFPGAEFSELSENEYLSMLSSFGLIGFFFYYCICRWCLFICPVNGYFY